jgi:hypothetical protein
MKSRPARWVTVAFALTLVLLAGCQKQEAVQEVQKEESGGSGFKVGYATEGITATEDPEAFQKSVEEMYKKSQERGVAVTYKNDAFSSDGINFSCYIGNPQDSGYDMFIAIYGDDKFTDELYLSQLLKPGQAFEKLTLNHALDPGVNTVYVAFTQVEETEGEQSIRGQTVIAMKFHVSATE